MAQLTNQRSRIWRLDRPLLTAACLCAAACSGTIEGDPAGVASPPPVEQGPVTPVTPDVTAPGTTTEDGAWQPQPLASKTAYSPTSRLSRTEYARTVANAFGVEVASLNMPELPVDEVEGIQPNPEVEPLADYNVYVDAAVDLGGQLAPALAEQCDFAADAAGCTQQLLVPALTTLYRAPVGDAERDSLVGLIAEASTRTGNATAGVAHGLASALLEPGFLYRIEHGTGDVSATGGLALTARESASRLSYFLQHAPPDEQLLQVAGGLTLDAATASQNAERLLTTPLGRERIWGFVKTWLSLGEDSAEAEPLEQAMLEETRRFVEHILVDEKAPLSDLFTARYSFINAELAEHYGVPAPAQDWEQYEFPETARRQGILTHASFLSSNGGHKRDVAWIFRGKVVFEHLFCGQLPAPPPGVEDEEVSSRTEDARCKGCHAQVDPIGQFFDNYDEHGALIEAVATPGDIKVGSDVDASYADVSDFLEALPTSQAWQQCFVRLWFRQALGRDLVGQDQASFDMVNQTLQQTSSLKKALGQLVATPAFNTVYAKPSEMVCQ